MTKPKLSPHPEQSNPTGLRRFLYATAATTGAAILIVEILGAKMLSPFVGTSHFVWTAQITITLISLAVGYYFGGWLVDRSPKLDRLFWCILLAAVYLSFTIVIVEPVAYACLSLNLAVGALFASATLFFVPLTLLAAVGPFLVRVLARSFTTVGGQVGLLSAISAFGSVLGTLLIGYVLIPFLPNSVTMLATAGVLMLVVLLYYILWRKDAPKASVLMVIVFGLSLGGLGTRASLTHGLRNLDELYRANSNFGHLQVIQTRDGQRRYYLNDFLVQNSYDPRDGKSISLFTYMLRYLAQAYTPQLRDVLCIGLGVGIVPMDLARQGSRVDVVEINPAVVPLAQKYFGLDPAKLNISIGDGRYLVNSTTNKYDAIILDAFLGDSSPSHLMTREAFENMRRILKPEGTLVINSFGDFTPGLDFFVGSLDKTLGAVFKSVRIHATGNGNVFFVASDQPQLTYRPPSIDDAHPDTRAEVSSCLASQVATDAKAGRILTDDFNPVEFYDAHNRERHRRILAGMFRKIR